MNRSGFSERHLAAEDGMQYKHPDKKTKVAIEIKNAEKNQSCKTSTNSNDADAIGKVIGEPSPAEGANNAGDLQHGHENCNFQRIKAAI